MHLQSKLCYLLSVTLIIRHASAFPMPGELTESDIQAEGANYPSASGRLFNIDGKRQYFSGKD